MRRLKIINSYFQRLTTPQIRLLKSFKIFLLHYAFAKNNPLFRSSPKINALLCRLIKDNLIIQSIEELFIKKDFLRHMIQNHMTRVIDHWRKKIFENIKYKPGTEKNFYQTYSVLTFK